ncbi:signal peptide-containing protein [Theileria equi strain WA]|uniref:Signal peptide-containing protein n=1 Tax=Theileria equi strain WA TaxID=1537102 RepID=L0AYK7_THEEQ|nr:signal peptide-containing protein [Theileria equi strain WA]AFZ80101.1 signal peptide-containing protein [Theileria equi strain WA]|eukprot:XP_004829767.1 signal peptide-containing protein [Theileria equi strain WA]
MKILLFSLILQILMLVHAPPPNPKILLDLDISGYMSEKISVAPSIEFSGGTTYHVRKNSRHNYIIDTVRDGVEMLIGGDPRNTSRFVLVVLGDGGTKYVRIITNRISDIRGSYVKTVDEFVKNPGDALYAPVVREPLQIDIMTQKTTDIIREDVVLEPLDAYSDNADERPKVPKVLHTKLTIQPKMVNKYIIGVVRFGRHLITEETNNVMRRTILWEGGLDAPRIIVITSFSFGELWTETHEFDRIESEFKLKSSKKRGIHSE